MITTLPTHSRPLTVSDYSKSVGCPLRESVVQVLERWVMPPNDHREERWRMTLRSRVDAVLIDVRRAEVDRVDDLAGAMGRAFAADPILIWPFFGSFEPDEDRAIALFKLMLGHYIPEGVAWEASDGMASAVWVPPDQIDLFTTMDRETRRPIAALTDDDGARYEAMWDWMGSHVPDEPIWYLDMLGVDPRAQGRGYGAALLAIGVDAARRDGVPAFLETSSEENVRFYEHHGFTVVGDGDAPGGGPHVWFMRAEP